MATVGNLFVNVGANTAGLAKGLDAANRKVEDFSTKAQNTLGALGQAVPLGGIGGAISSAIDRMGALKDMTGVFTEGVRAAKKAQEELTKAIEASRAAEAALASAKGARRNVGMARAELARQGIDPNKAQKALSIVDTSPLREGVRKSADAAAAAEKALAGAQTSGAALTASKHAESLTTMREALRKATERHAAAEKVLAAAEARAGAAGRLKGDTSVAKATEKATAALNERRAAQDAINAAQQAAPSLQGEQAILKATEALTAAKQKQVAAESALAAARKRNQEVERTRAGLSARGIDTKNLGKSLQLADLGKFQKSVETAKAAVADKEKALTSASGGFRMFGLVGKGAALAVGAVAIAAVAATAGLLGLARSKARAMDALKDESVAAGITIENYQRLEHTYHELGVAQGMAAFSTMRLGYALDDAVQGSQDARDKFKRLGLDYAQIAAMSPDAALNATIAAIRKLGSQRERVAMLKEMFGKGGIGLAAAVNATNEELALAAERASKLVIPADIVSDMADTNDAVEAASKSFDNMLTMLASTFSPVLRDLADEMFDLFTADPQALLGGLQSIALVCAVIYDAVALIVNVLKAVWNAVQAIVGIVGSALAGAFAAVAKVVQMVAYGVEWLIGSTHGVSEAIGNAASVGWETAKEAAKGAGADATEAFQASVDAVNPNATIAVIKGIDKSMQGVRETAQEPVLVNIKPNEAALKEIDKTIENLKEKIATLTIGESASALAKMKDLGATDAQLEETAALMQKVKALEASKSINDEIKKAQDEIAKSSMTAAEYAWEKARAEGASAEQANTLAALTAELELLEKQKKAREETLSTLDQLRGKVDAIGKSENEVLISKMMQSGATRDQVDEAMRLQGILDQAKVEGSLTDHFKKLNERLAEANANERELLENQLRGMGLAGQALEEAVSQSLAINSQIAAAEKAAANRKEVESTLEGLADEFKDIGLDEIGKLTRRLSEAGATQEQIDQAVGMKNAIDAASGAEKIAGVTDSVSTAIGNLTLAGTVSDTAWQGSLVSTAQRQADLLTQIAANTAVQPEQFAESAAQVAGSEGVRGMDRSQVDLSAIMSASLEQLKSINANTKSFSEVLS
jgi:hypothetical protein